MNNTHELLDLTLYGNDGCRLKLGGKYGAEYQISSSTKAILEGQNLTLREIPKGHYHVIDRYMKDGVFEFVPCELKLT